LDLNPNWVVLQLDIVFMLSIRCQKGSYFKNFVQQMRTSSTYPFVYAFYAFESPLFYNHYNHDGNVIVIPFAMRTYLGDPLGGALFALVHLGALHFTTSHFFYYLFPSIANDTHIIDLFPLYPLHMNIFKLISVRYIFLLNLRNV
jgi:hypothetical protein